MKKTNVLIFCSLLFCGSLYAQDSVTKTISSLFKKNKQIQQHEKQVKNKKTKNMFISQEKMQKIKNQCELESDTEIEMQKCVQDLVKKELLKNQNPRKEKNAVLRQKKINSQSLTDNKEKNKNLTLEKQENKLETKINLNVKKRKKRGPVVETIVNPNVSKVAKELYKKEIEKNKQIEQLKKF